MPQKLFIPLPFLFLLFLLLQPSIEMQEDLGRQIKMGEVILDCLCVPQVNLFSYTFSNFQIVNYSWLSSVIFFSIANVFGINGLLAFKIILFFAVFLLLYLSVKKNIQPFWFMIFMIFSLSIFSNRLVLRPELLSFLFLSLYLFFIEKYKESKNIQLLLPLPFIQLIWVNSHVYFFIGPILYFLFLLGEAISRKKLPHKSVLIILFIILGVNLTNPMFVIGAMYPFLIFSNYGLQTNENFSPFTNNPLFLADYAFHIWIFEFVILLFATGVFMGRKKAPFFLSASTTFCMFIAFKLVRALPLFALVSLPALSYIYSHLEGKVKNSGLTLTLKAFFALIALFLVIQQTHFILVNNRLNPGFIDPYPKGIQFIKDNNIPGPFFNSFGIGGNIIFHLYPDKIYIDARPEAYPASFMESYQKHFTEPEYFQEQARKYNFNTLIIDKSENAYWTHFLSENLLNTGEWVKIYEDLNMIILIQNRENNANIIQKFEIK